MEARQAAALLAIALRALTPGEQLVVVLLELEGRSVKEICQLTGSSSIAVRVRGVRARAKLRQALERMEKENR